MKTYSVKSSAVRAAKALVAKFEEITSYEVEEITGLWSINVVVNTKDYSEALLKIVNGVDVDAPVVEEKVEEEKNMVQVEINQSTIGKPCNQVWEVAIEMNEAAKEDGEPAPARKDVIAKCVEMGIAFNTARTQYQAWFKASKA